MEALFVDKLPLRITKDDFKRKYLANFPALASGHDDIIEDAIDNIYTLFYGVQTIWNWQPKQVWFDKTRLCFLHLTAWYIGDMHPTYLRGTTSMGGVKLRRKRIGDTDITFDTENGASSGNYQNLLGGLLSNPFGKQAYIMITSCGKRVLLR